MRFHSAMATLEPQKYAIAGTVGTENILLVSGRLVYFPTHIFHYLCNRVVFFSRPSHENFKFLKNCPYDFHKILHSQSTPKGASACAKAIKSYDWKVRNIAKISPKMAEISPKTAIFRLFSIFAKTVHTIRTQLFFTVILHHIMVLYVQFH